MSEVFSNLILPNKKTWYSYVFLVSQVFKTVELPPTEILLRMRMIGPGPHQEQEVPDLLHLIKMNHHGNTCLGIFIIIQLSFENGIAL